MNKLFGEFDVVFKLDTARAELRGAQENLCITNRVFGPWSDESHRAREIVRKDRQRVDVLERAVEMKKAYLFG